MDPRVQGTLLPRAHPTRKKSISENKIEGLDDALFFEHQAEMRPCPPTQSVYRAAGERTHVRITLYTKWLIVYYGLIPAGATPIQTNADMYDENSFSTKRETTVELLNCF